jgi:hypothetical protein
LRSPRGGLRNPRRRWFAARRWPARGRLDAGQKSNPADSDTVVCAAAVSLALQLVVIALGWHAWVTPGRLSTDEPDSAYWASSVICRIEYWA